MRKPRYNTARMMMYKYEFMSQLHMFEQELLIGGITPETEAGVRAHMERIKRAIKRIDDWRIAYLDRQMKSGKMYLEN